MSAQIGRACGWLGGSVLVTSNSRNKKQESSFFLSWTYLKERCKQDVGVIHSVGAG
jgi:hypothetical protein